MLRLCMKFYSNNKENIKVNLLSLVFQHGKKIKTKGVVGILNKKFLMKLKDKKKIITILKEYLLK